MMVSDRHLHNFLKIVKSLESRYRSTSFQNYLHWKELEIHVNSDNCGKNSLSLQFMERFAHLFCYNVA